MPEICRFYGIVIGMFYDDHGVPQFHADYQGTEASIGIDPLRVLEGELPRRAERFVLEWGTLHQDELLEDWRRARERKALLRIDPLD